MTQLSQEIVDLVPDHVLGLLSPSEDALMAELSARDADLATLVGDLRDRLLPLDLSATPQPLPAGFTATVLSRIATLPQGALVAPANIPAAPRRLWPGLAAAVVGLAVGLGAATLRPRPAPQVVAVLVDDAGVPQAVVDDYGNDTATVRFVADITVPDDRALQVWTLPSADMGPVSLGVLDGRMAADLRFDDLPDPAAQQLYEVTLEPLGGSPTGRPTGPIIGKGLAAAQTGA
ncbi:Anti-sigma-K factor RskA [Loktanella fryxellensis]|uniref:Anti-sigma-K factor RskA n=1 Tax=Loktanella fryxellensis TaxID=245187 RepID=A0A1H8BRM6_9RHOB|nr:anti-sigma factor [Loktanella fryxellensis]SEM85515.1 Anti-sigma-K factor RskA [Loktanella fryxellensis]